MVCVLYVKEQLPYLRYLSCFKKSKTDGDFIVS